MKRLTQDVLFETDHLRSNLGRKTARGGLTTVTAQGIQFLLVLGGTAVLARLLSPSDFGLIGMATVVVGFAAMFKDAGLSMATVQRDQITREQISTLFWVNVMLNIILAACVLASAPLVALFYRREELAGITAALSLSFVISGFMIQHQALLRRHMHFFALATIAIAAQVANLGTSVALAALGWGYWSLVGGAIALSLAGTTLTWVLCPWRPSRPRRRTGARDMLRFGGQLTGFNVLNYFSRNMDNVLIGRVLGAQALGYYNKAYHLMTQPLAQINAPVSAVAVPALSRLLHDPLRYRAFYTRMLSSITTVTTPIIVFLAVYSEEVVRIVLGDRWLSVAPIFTILAFAGFWQPATNTTGWLFVSQDRTRQMLYWGVFSSVVVVTSFVVGLSWGVIGVAAAYAVASVCLQVPLIIYVTRRGPVRARDYLKALVPAATIACGLLVTLIPLRYLLQAHGLALRISVGAGTTVAVLALTMATSAGSRTNVTTFVRTLRGATGDT